MERPADPLALQAQIRDRLAELDRRDVVASKFGLPLASDAAAPLAHRAPRRPLLWKPLALAAALIGFAAVSAVFLARHIGQHQAIGVQIGVPEKSAAAVAKNVTAPPEASAASAAAESNIVTTPPGAEPPVLTSVASEPSEEGTETQTAAENSQQPAQVASSAPPPTEESPAQVVMNNAPEPAPPSEGPATSVGSLPTQTALAQTESEATPAEELPVSRKPILPRVPPERKTALAKSEKPPHNKRVRVASVANHSAPLPRGSVRAKYLGTAADGTLVFGLPSAEKVYVSPPRSE